jgi:hypothetical protein
VRSGDPALILLVGAAVVIAVIVAARISHQIGLPACSRVARPLSRHAV